MKYAPEPIPKKSLGQHWLTDLAALADIADAAEIKSSDTVLEIGPGLGTLTALLVERAQQVIAVEFDEKLARDLPKRIKASNLEVITQDILSLDFTNLPVSYKIVANIPYYLTSNLIRVISETSNPPATAVLLVQKEVAERVAAKPGASSILSVTAQYYWEVSLAEQVPAHLFTPPPKIDSQILVLRRRPTLLFPDVDSKKYFTLVKVGFAQRRKTLLNSLSAGLQLERDETAVLLEKSDIKATDRAQTLTLDDWHNLYLEYFN